ncbi:hypothetical protein RHMOL_Rhmol02G0006700 [Rhododendron molle]|uniref:Uncharacterized protein n=1 Tax=Rhododendron molle TaxID=49168 RepID=A0ACC0PLR0_RHOML|nr:hypothetical protein RHMOL_Rhmol02G0006700 [Rhododendron molle]
MVFFNPFTSRDEQLRKYAMLSLLAGARLNGRSPEDLPTTLFTLFEPANDLDDDDSEGEAPGEKLEDIVFKYCLSKGLIVHGGSVVVPLCSNIIPTLPSKKDSHGRRLELHSSSTDDVEDLISFLEEEDDVVPSSTTTETSRITPETTLVAGNNSRRRGNEKRGFHSSRSREERGCDWENFGVDWEEG